MSWSDFSIKPFEWLGFGGKQATSAPETSVYQSLSLPQSGPLESAASLANRRIRVIDPALGAESYKHLTHHIDPQNLQGIEEELSKVSNEEIAKLCDLLNECQYHLLEGKAYPFVALAAVKKGLMSEADFSNVMFYWSLKASGKHQVVTLKLFNEDGSSNPAVENAILETCHAPKTSLLHELGSEHGPFATVEDVDEFFEKARSLPPSQQCIFLTQDHLTPLERTAPHSWATIVEMREERIIRQVRYGASFNFFDQFTSGGLNQHGFPKGDRLEMLGSLGVYQTMGQVLFGEECVALRPTIGLSTADEIQENGRTDQRDIGLPFPGIKLPDTADELRCKTAEEFLRHDIGYHFWMASEIPSKHRKAFEVVAQEVKEIMKDPTLPESCQKYLKEFYERLIDLEFSFYRHDLSSNSNQMINFLLSLHSLIQITAVRINFQEGRFNGKDQAYDLMSGATIRLVSEFSKHNILYRIAERLYEQRERFATEFGIDLFNQEILDQVYDKMVSDRRNSSPPLLSAIFDVTRPLARWFARYSASQTSLPQILLNIRAKKQFFNYMIRE